MGVVSAFGMTWQVAFRFSERGRESFARDNQREMSRARAARRVVWLHGERGCLEHHHDLLPALRQRRAMKQPFNAGPVHQEAKTGCLIPVGKERLEGCVRKRCATDSRMLLCLSCCDPLGPDVRLHDEVPQSPAGSGGHETSQCGRQGYPPASS